MEPLVLVLAALLGLSSALLEVHVGQTSVSTIQGQRVVLPIWYTSRSQRIPYVSWVFGRPGANRLQILTYLDGTVKVQETYLKNRTGFVYSMPHFNISIAINNTQEMDSGEYMCTVNIADDDTISGKNIGLLNLTVLVPPSPPICQLHGKPYLGGNVTMSCKSAFSKPSPKYSWQRTAPNTQVFFAPTQDLARGTLMLRNLSKDMSGMYVCTAANIAGSSKCNITLEVNSPLSAAVIAGAVVGSLIGVGLMILFVLQMFIYRNKKKDAQEEMANEIK